MAKQKQTDQDDSYKVILKPFLGIKPTQYVFVGFVVLVLFLFYMVFFFPGVRNYGSKLSVRSEPSGALVSVNGNIVGSTPLTIFVDAGPTEVTVEKNGFISTNQNIEIDGRLFGSLFFPRRQDLQFDLESSDYDQVVKNGVRTFQELALTGAPYQTYQHPPVLQEMALSLPMEYLADNSAAIRTNILVPLLKDIHSKHQLRNWLGAYFLVTANKQIAGPKQLIEFSNDFTRILSSNKTLFFWMFKVLPAEYIEEVAKMPAISDVIDNYSLELDGAIREQMQNESKIASSATTDTLTLQGVRFVKIPAGSFVMGYDENLASNDGVVSIPHEVSVNSFYIADREITVEQFQQFLSENSDWRKDNISILNNGFVDEHYLQNFENLSTYAPVTNISYFAASAYCQWFQGAVESSIPNHQSESFQVRLPTEQEWEYAALLNRMENPIFSDSASEQTPLPLTQRTMTNVQVFDMLGNLWEWCDTWYHPSEYAFSGLGVDSPKSSTAETSGLAVEGVQKVVRGGSWANDSHYITEYTRGSLPASWSSETVGFRPVLIVGPQ